MSYAFPLSFLLSLPGLGNRYRIHGELFLILMEVELKGGSYEGQSQ